MLCGTTSFPGGTLGDALLACETCVIAKTAVWQNRYENVAISERKESGSGGPLLRTDYETRKGVVSTLERLPREFLWKVEHLFSGPGDYDALEALILEERFRPDFETFRQDDIRYGVHSTIGRPTTVRTPLNDLVYVYMGVETFCFEWMDRRSEVLRLMKALEKSYWDRVRLIADSPARFGVIEGNVDVHVFGLDRFREFCMPYIEGACQIFHEKGKLAGIHLDGDHRLLAPVIADTTLDFVESHTPPPDCDFPVAEAREAWPDKVLIVNFLSSLHRLGPAQVVEEARRILREGSRRDGFIFGLIENVSEDAAETMAPLAKAVRNFEF
jgi:hypothetical protein